MTPKIRQATAEVLVITNKGRRRVASAWRRLRRLVSSVWRRIRQGIRANLTELFVVAGLGLITYTTWTIHTVIGSYLAGVLLCGAGLVIGLSRRGRQ